LTGGSDDCPRIERSAVGLTLRCGEICGICDFVAHGETEEEIFLKMREHIKTTHGLVGYSKFINDEFRKFIHEDVTRHPDT